jgi:hypothetical protein
MKNYTLLFLLLNVSFLFCTKEILSSKDNTGAALPGVNIVEKELLTVFHKYDGAYKIKVSEGATLVSVTLVF